MKNLGIKISASQLLNIKGGDACNIYSCACRDFRDPAEITICGNPDNWCMQNGNGPGACTQIG